MKIGWTNLGYPVERTILNKTPNVDYVRSRSFGAVVSRFCGHLGLQSPVNENSVYIGGTADRHIDLFHFFNLLGCGLCKKPYVTTFETCVPRALKPGSYWFKRGLESLMSEQCRRLLALSECAKRIQLDALKQFLTGPELKELENKIMVLHPPQELLVESCNRFFLGGAIRYIFVGKDAFRKGAAESLRALKRIREDVEVEAYVIGRFNHVDYASSWGVDSATELQKLIAENSWIHHFNSLPNEEVLTLAKTCHIGLLPTRHDTYGYSVLEFQACGLPCITTDVRALPEINNDKCGWIVQVARDGEVDLSSDESLHDLSVRIEDGVFGVLVKIANDPASVMHKGVAALERIRREHAPIMYGKKLMSIYEEAIW